MLDIELSVKEFHILSELMAREMPGRDLHRSLCEEVSHISGPGFYKIMAKLRNMGLVSYRSEKIEVNGYNVREHRYTICVSGRKAVEEIARYHAGKNRGALVDA